MTLTISGALEATNLDVSNMAQITLQAGNAIPLSGLPLGLTQAALPEGWLESFLANMQNATPITLASGGIGLGGLGLTHAALPEGWLESFLANTQNATPITIGHGGIGQGGLGQLNLPEGWLESVLANVTSGNALNLVAGHALNLVAGNALPLSGLELTSHELVMSDVQLVGVPHTIEGFQQMIA